MKHSIKTLRNGFSLIELLLVLSIISVISSIALPSYSKIRTESRENAVVQVAHTLQVGLESYALRLGDYPNGVYMSSELIEVLQESEDLNQNPVNPFTGKIFSLTDTSGGMDYVFDSLSGTYLLTVLGYQNVNVLRVLSNN